jgi:hypothetical protein
MEEEIKPLNWQPDPNIGYTVVRRPDGGMTFTFTDINLRTLKHWREFALAHLYDSDRLVRNLYDLRQIENLPGEAIEFAVEANSDPSSRHIRLAVVVANETVKAEVQKVSDLTAGGGAEIGIFSDMDEAEKWLARPLTTMI